MIKKIIIISVLAIILIVAWYFLWYKPSQNILMEGAPCKINGLNGTVTNGVCKVIVIEEGLPISKK